MILDKEVSSYHGQLSRTYCGTDPNFASELIEKKPYNPFLANDWTMDVMLFAMINGKFPFHFLEGRKNPQIMLTEQTICAICCKNTSIDLKLMGK